VTAAHLRGIESRPGQVLLVVNRGRSDHEALHWRLGTNHRVNDRGREATELSSRNGNFLAINQEDDRSFKDHEHLVASKMEVQVDGSF
jgi:hypothetical protein